MAILGEARQHGSVFLLARDTATGEECRFKIADMPLLPPEEMAAWVATFYRHLEYLEHRPWTDLEDGHRLLYPVPLHNVRFNQRPLAEPRPDPRRRSIFLDNPQPRRLLINRS